MDFQPSEQQVMLRESAARFLRDEYDFARRRKLISVPSDTAGPGLWNKLAEQGWPAACLPEERGGLGGSHVELSILMQEMGRALYVGPYLSTVAIGAAILQSLGGPRADELAGGIAEGELRLALAHGEPGGRGFLDNPACRAVMQDDGFAITGRKRLVHDASTAHIFVVSAEGPDGLSLFLVEPSAANLARRDYRTLDNAHASDLEFDGTRAELLAGPDKAGLALDAALYSICIALGAEAIGIAEAALHHTRDYVTGRRQFGQSLIDFQVVQHRIADMFVEIEQVKALLLYALSCAEGDTTELRRAAIGLKILGGQVSKLVAGQGLHLHGGMGMTDEMPISHYYRRACVLESQFGNSDYFEREYARGLC